MTSRTLSINLFKGEAKRKAWIYIITLFIMLVVRPGRILMVIDSLLAWGQPVAKKEMVGSMSGYLTFTHQMNMLPLFVAAVVFAITTFIYLYSRAKVDMYHSIPLSRKSMFVSLISSAYIPYVVIETITTIMIFLVLASKDLITEFSVGIVLSTYVYNLVFFVVFFALASLAILLTGNLLTGVLGGIVFFVGAATIKDIVTDYMSYCFQTYFINYEHFSWIEFVTCPLYACQNMDRLLSDGVLKFVVMLIIAAVLVIIDYIAFEKRPLETIGKAMAFNVLKPIIRIPAVICAALIGGIYVVFIAGNLPPVWYWAAFVVCGVLAHVIVNSIFEDDFKKAFKHPLQLAGCLVVAAAIGCVFLFDLFGYDGYIPNEANVDSVSVSLTSINSGISHYKPEVNSTGIELTYVENNAYVLEHHSTDNIKPATYLAELGIGNIDLESSAFDRNRGGVDKPYAVAETNIISRPYPSPEENLEKNYYVIKYHLKNGRDVYRSYFAGMEESYGASAAIFDENEYKEATCQLDLEYEYGNFDVITGSDGWGNELFKLKGDDMKSFLDALKADYMNQTLDMIANEIPVAGIGAMSKDHYYNDYLYGYYIYPSSKNVRAFLESKGYDIPAEAPTLELDRIEKLEVNSYLDDTSYKAVYESGKDDEMIKTIVNNSDLDCYAYTNSVLRQYTPNIDVYCTYLNDKGYMMDYYLKIPYGKLPEQVYTDLAPVEQ